MTALEQFTDQLMDKLYPEKSLPHYVNLDIFRPWMRHQIMSKIKNNYLGTGSPIIFLPEEIIFPIRADASIPDITLPDVVVEYLDRYKVLDHELFKK